MASEATVYSKDGTWKIEVEAWKNNFLFYSSIGTQVSVYHKIADTNIWGNATTSWKSKSARSITIANTYKGPVIGGGVGQVVDVRTWENTDEASLKQWAVGIKISIPGGVGGNAILDIDSVDGEVSVNIGNETLTTKVSASSIFSDSGIW